MDAVAAYGSQALGVAWPVVWSLAKIVAIVLPILLLVAYTDLLGAQADRLDAHPGGPEPRGPGRAGCSRSPTR